MVVRKDKMTKALQISLQTRHPSVAAEAYQVVAKAATEEVQTAVPRMKRREHLERRRKCTSLPTFLHQGGRACNGQRGAPRNVHQC